MVKLDLFSAITVALGLTIANFAWQALGGDPQWAVAGERSFFQAMAVVACWLSARTAP